jgi:hypothetical protein
MQFDFILLNVFIIVCICLTGLTVLDLVINAIRDHKGE